MCAPKEVILILSGLGTSGIYTMQRRGEQFRNANGRFTSAARYSIIVSILQMNRFGCQLFFSFDTRSDRSGPSQGDQRLSVDSGQLAEGVYLVQCRWAIDSFSTVAAPPNKGQFGTAQATFQWRRHSTDNIYWYWVGLAKVLSGPANGGSPSGTLTRHLHLAPAPC